MRLKCTYDVAVAMDSFLLDYHIGEYQSILAYHNNKGAWDALTTPEKVKALPLSSRA